MKTVTTAMASDFAQTFGAYVTGNWKENHLEMYLREEEGGIFLSCYGLGKVNWSRFAEPDDPFYSKAKELINHFPQAGCEMHIQFYCGVVRSYEHISCEGVLL